MTMTKLRNFTASEKQEFDRLVARLESPDVHLDAIKLAKTARIWFGKGEISEKDREHLRTYCRDSDNPPRESARKIAREISLLVFGKEIKTEYD
ncbi:MAG: hypothetical protein WC556_12520 [Candidatus Methanoperedens sp.]